MVGMRHLILILVSFVVFACASAPAKKSDQGGGLRHLGSSSLLPVQDQSKCGKYFEPAEPGMGDYRIQMISESGVSGPEFGLKVLTAVIFGKLDASGPFVEYYSVGLSGRVFLEIHLTREIYETARACLPPPT